MRADGLDFWLGDWVATWDGGSGRNSVTRELGGKVLVERFVADPPETFAGTSLSVGDDHGRWRQTWADSEGSYWTFVGGPQTDGTFVLATTTPVDAQQVYKRMVFSDIEADSFRWRWEFSPDGRDWEQRWAISYRRAA